MQKLARQTRFEVLQKTQVTCPVLRNPKLVSDLKLDLVMMTSQQSPNFYLMSNPAVLPPDQMWM